MHARKRRTPWPWPHARTCETHDLEGKNGIYVRGGGGALLKRPLVDDTVEEQNVAADSIMLGVYGCNHESSRL